MRKVKGGYNIMTNEALVTKIQTEDDKENNMLALWQQNKGLIEKIAYKYSAYEDVEDLKQQGYIGLFQAAEHYKEGKGVPFANYAAACIKSCMTNYIENCGRVVRVPVVTLRNMVKYDRLSADMMSCYGRKPTDEEAKKLLGLTDERMECLNKAKQACNIKSLNVPLGDYTEIELYELVKSDTDVEGEALDRVELEELKALLWDMVARLPNEQAQVIESRYAGNMTFKEIGIETGKSENAVRNTEKKALWTLRHSRGSKRLILYLPEYAEYSEGLKGVGVSTFMRTWTSATERVAIRLC